MKSDSAADVARERPAPRPAARTASAGWKTGAALALPDGGCPEPSLVSRSGGRPAGQGTWTPRSISRPTRSKLSVFNVLTPGRGDIGAGLVRIPRGSSVSPVVRRAFRW
jgi:hypothetical protein